MDQEKVATNLSDHVSDAVVGDGARILGAVGRH